MWVLWLVTILELGKQEGLELAEESDKVSLEGSRFSLSVSIAPSYSEQLSEIRDKSGCPFDGWEGSVGQLLWMLCWLQSLFGGLV